MFLIAIPAATGLFFLSDKLVLTLSGKEFYSSITVLKFYSLLIPVICYSYFTGTITLLANKKEKTYASSAIIASIGNVVFNFVFIPIMGATGAVLGTLVSQVLAIIYRLLKEKKLFVSVVFFDFNKLKILFSSMIMGLIIYLVRYKNLSGYFELISTICIGIISYGLILILIREKNVLEFVTKLKWRKK